MQLLEDISTYQRDRQSAIWQHIEEKKKKHMSRKGIGEGVRKDAVEDLSRKLIVTYYTNIP